MSEEKKVPEIRFKGFGGEWEVKELSQVSDKNTEKNTSLVYSETFTNSAEFGIISQRDYFDNDISNSNKIGGYYVVQPEDFVYNPRISTFAPCGPINRNALGRAGVMSPLYTVFRTKGVNTIFIEYFFQTKLWHTFMFLNGDTGARADRFSIKDSVFFELPLLLPKVNEQLAIGNTFQKFDSLINQHQQQHDKLSNIKNAMLEKMFPKQGETIPEIRFKGFSGVWEEKGITDISKVFIGLVTTMTTSYRSKGVLLIRNSDIKSNRFEFSVNPIYLDEKFADENSSRRLMFGDVVTVHTGDVGTSAVVTEKALYTTI